MKTRPVGVELFRADGQTDVTNLIVALPNFANAHNKQVLKLYTSTGGLKCVVRIVCKYITKCVH